jgi:hypothetical protein
MSLLYFDINRLSLYQATNLNFSITFQSKTLKLCSKSYQTSIYKFLQNYISTYIFIQSFTVNYMELITFSIWLTSNRKHPNSPFKKMSKSF